MRRTDEIQLVLTKVADHQRVVADAAARVSRLLAVVGQHEALDHVVLEVGQLAGFTAVEGVDPQVAAPASVA